MSVKVVKSILVAVVAIASVPALAQPGATPRVGQVDNFSDPDDLLPRRNGFNFMASIGRGMMDITCRKCGDNDTKTEAVAFATQLGYRFSQSWGLGTEFSLLQHSGNYWFQDPIWQTAWRLSATVGPTYYIGDRFWVRGGLGVSRHWVDPGVDGSPEGPFETFDLPTAGKGPVRPPDEEIKETGLASALSAGVEVLGDRYFSFDVQLRTGGSLTQDGWAASTASLALGVNWF
ncbi:MAG: outer membrane beta-barrel protein [Deltaproteobacteria bacterium]|nr:outer membrane beta-barrel protein [Deltaproteobacteria bacterium]